MAVTFLDLILHNFRISSAKSSRNTVWYKGSHGTLLYWCAFPPIPNSQWKRPLGERSLSPANTSWCGKMHFDCKHPSPGVMNVLLARSGLGCSKTFFCSHFFYKCRALLKSRGSQLPGSIITLCMLFCLWCMVSGRKAGVVVNGSSKWTRSTSFTKNCQASLCRSDIYSMKQEIIP